MKTSRRVLLTLTSVAVPALSAGCICCGPAVPVGEMVTETSVISIVTAESVTVVVDVGVCDLVIEGGGGTLLDAEFTYNIPGWKPEITYTESGTHGKLTVRQPEVRGSLGRGADCDWRLRFSDDIPLTIKMNAGVGHSDLDLAGMMLTDLDADIGVGDIVVELGDTADQDVTVGIDSGVGDVLLSFPEQVNVILDCDMGVGGISSGGLVKRGGVYVTDNPMESRATIRVNVDIGVGNMRVESPGHHARI